MQPAEDIYRKKCEKNALNNLPGKYSGGTVL